MYKPPEFLAFEKRNKVQRNFVEVTGMISLEE